MLSDTPDRTWHVAPDMWRESSLRVTVEAGLVSCPIAQWGTGMSIEQSLLALSVMFLLARCSPGPVFVLIPSA